MTRAHCPAFAVSSWSVHRLLGISYDNGPAAEGNPSPQPTWGSGSLSLMELPAALAMRGYERVELCHFHLASLDRDYLKSVAAAFLQAGVLIQTLLIDDGDITNLSTQQRDLAWIERWITAAGVLGAGHARVIAGKSKPGPETLATSVAGLKHLVARAEVVAPGVRIVTENWFDLLGGPVEVDYILDKVGPSLGFLADTGNWRGPHKYEELKHIFARAELCHCKTNFAAGLKIDGDDFGACIAAAQLAGYQGPMTLIFDSDGDEWEGLAAERDFVRKAYA